MRPMIPMMHKMRQTYGVFRLRARSLANCAPRAVAWLAPLVVTVVIAVGLLAAQVEPRTGAPATSFGMSKEPATHENEHAFLVFDTVLYENRPDMSRYGLPRLTVVYDPATLARPVDGEGSTAPTLAA